MFIAFLLAATPVAGASSPASLDVTEQRNAAVGFALTMTATVERMKKSCAAVPEAAPQFSEASRQWVVRNKPYADAANGWMDYVRSQIARQKGPKVADAFISNTYSVFSDKASMIAAESLPGSPPAAASCLKWVDTMNAHAFDLEQNPEFVQDLKDIRAFYESGAGGHGR
ncbi:hypothetical protein [Frateuria defendens]|uniref:hypothetical protein n=1 Tax=Frateuria defendens TaxID=2219559 RepID=UPI001292F9D4|nr:hypothetical protein [Frateuria defendens]